MKRLECLDGLRGALALYVLLTHMAPFATLPAWIVRPLSHGEAGVDLFFILSGLVIVRSLERFDYHAQPFLIARVARIFPVFLPVFALAVAAQPIGVGFARMPWIGPDSTARLIWSDGWPATWAPELAVHLTMLHGLFPNAILPDVWVRFLGAAWSLSTEWQFYILVVVVGARFGRGERGLWRLAVLLLGLAVLGVAWRDAVAAPWQFSRAFLLNKAAYFALGVASAATLRDPTARLRFLGVLAVVLTLCVTRDNPLKILPPIIWLVCMAAQSAQEQAGWSLFRELGRILRSAPLRWLGAVSYCVYLVNEPIQKLLGVTLSKAVGGEAALFTALWLPAAVVLPLGAAWLLHVWVELPALRRGHGLAAATLRRLQPDGTEGYDARPHARVAIRSHGPSMSLPDVAKSRG